MSGAGNPDYQAYIFSVHDGTLLETLPGNNDHVSCVSWRDDILLMGAKNNRVSIFRTNLSI